MRYLFKKNITFLNDNLKSKLIICLPQIRCFFVNRTRCVMARDMNKIVSAYKELAKVPSLVSGKILKNTISLTWSQRNIEEGKNSTFVAQHVFDKSSLQVVAETTPVDITSELLSSHSPSETYKAVLRSVNNKEKKEILEIWTKQNLFRSVDLTALDLHGNVYTDVEFSSFGWSSDETRLMYIAEKKKKKSEAYYKRKAPKSESGDQEVSQGNEYVYEDDWGEQLVGKKKSVICIYNINEDAVSILEGIPEDICPAKVIWSPDDSYVIGIALRTSPRKLGLIYCSNRSSTIFTLDFKGNYVELKLANKSVKAPRCTPDGKHIIWLQREAGGPHASCMELKKTTLPITENNMLEDIIGYVETETVTVNGHHPFYGLYNTGFVKNCWTNDGRLVLTSPGKSRTTIYVINLSKHSINEIYYDDGSQSILDIRDDWMLITRKNFIHPDQVFIGKIAEDYKEENTVFYEITKPIAVPQIQNCKSEYYDMKHNNNDSVDEFSAIYVGPSSANKRTVPLIVWPHGGPHSVINNGYYLEYAFLLSMGYAVVCVNYRGSLGQGEKCVQFLKGKVGTADVSDCIFATEEALKKFICLDPNRVMLCGGSHGGFLVTHLAGQRPDMFRAVVSRNPVIDIASMSVISDIPDWCYFESGEEYSFVKNPSPEFLSKMRQKSPIMYVNQVKAPTLLQIGSKDLRVPPSQGIDYYHSLKAKGVKTRLNLYDDNHPLGSVPNEMDNLINTYLWFEENAS